MTDLELAIRKRWEDEIQTMLDPWPLGKRAIAYRYLFNQGIRQHDLERMIRQSLKEEAAKEKARQSTFP